MRLPICVLEKLNNLTNCEMNMYLWLVERQTTKGMVIGVSLSDFRKTMSKQSFYNSLRGLKAKGLIYVQHCKKTHDYNIGLMFDDKYYIDNSTYNREEKYINLNNKLFKSEKFKNLSSREKYMMLILYYRTTVTINAAGSKAVHKKKVEDFYDYFTKLFGRSKRRVREYLHNLKAFFNVTISGANYFIGRNRTTYALDKKDIKNGKSTGRKHFVMAMAKRHKLKGVTAKFVEDVANLYRNYIGAYDEYRIDFRLERAIKAHASDNNKTASAARINQLLKKEIERFAF